LLLSGSMSCGTVAGKDLSAPAYWRSLLAKARP
jgi:hypothetical protein